MLMDVDLKLKTARRVKSKPLKAFGLDERGFQQILFNSLDRLLPDEELILIAQSRQWQEEPDLMAIDAEGRLFIFELKVSESESKNLLQAIRYGQIFGLYKYEDLNRLFQKFSPENLSLADAHRRKFEKPIELDKFNKDQVFVVMTNGIDGKTREAVRYWKSRKLDVRPWIYRVYDGDRPGKMTVEIVPFRSEDSPYEDRQEGFFVLNTNYSNDPDDHEDMLKNKKAAAYSDPWKYKIEQIADGDTVFLYKSGTGIVACGIGSGVVVKSRHRPGGGPEDQYSMKLRNFFQVSPPIAAAEIKDITGNNYVFMGTMFGIDADAGHMLASEASKRKNK
jgi:hypothetical protein